MKSQPNKFASQLIPVHLFKRICRSDTHHGVPAPVSRIGFQSSPGPFGTRTLPLGEEAMDVPSS